MKNFFTRERLARWGRSAAVASLVIVGITFLFGFGASCYVNGREAGRKEVVGEMMEAYVVLEKGGPEAHCWRILNDLMRGVHDELEGSFRWSPSDDHCQLKLATKSPAIQFQAFFPLRRLSKHNGDVVFDVSGGSLSLKEVTAPDVPAAGNGGETK